MTDTYLDCEIYITDRDQARLSFPEGEYSDRPQLDVALEEHLRSLVADPQQYGTKLFAALFAPRLLDGYKIALELAKRANKRLRLRLHVANEAPAELQTLRWEFLRDPERNLLLGCTREVSLSRYLISLEPLPPRLKEPFRLLVAVADPSNVKDFDLPSISREDTLLAIEGALKPLRRQMTWEPLRGHVTTENLRRALVTGKFHALHLQAHGLRSAKGTVGLLLENNDGIGEIVDERQFSRIFEGERRLWLITLVACHSGVQTGQDPFSGLGPGLVRHGIPAVVAMRQAITFDGAARFCQYFYEGLAHTGYVDAAVNEARYQLSEVKVGPKEFGIPVLFMRLLDGLLWEPRPPDPTVRLDADSEIPWDQILATLRSDNVLPFLGPGLWRGLLPRRAEIAARWVLSFAKGFPHDIRAELPAVAQVLETSNGDRVPHDLLLRELASELIQGQDPELRARLRGCTLSEVIAKTARRHFESHPDDPYRILAELPISTYVTTNPDSFMAAALHFQEREPVRHAFPWRLSPIRAELRRYKSLKGTDKKPLVFHIYGSDEDPTSLVLTEDDHLDFLRAIVKGEPDLPDDLLTKLSAAVLLFLGYDHRRLDCRVLLRGLMEQLMKAGRGKIAVLQVDADDVTREEEFASYMASCCSRNRLQFKVYGGTVQEFLKTLRDRWMASR